MRDHGQRAVGNRVERRRALDRAVRLQAARPRLDPVLVDRRRARVGLCPLAAVGVVPGRRDARRRGGGSVRREPRRGHAGGGGEADLERLAVGAECRAQAGGAQDRERDGGLLVGLQQPCGRDRGAGGATHRGGMEAAVIERGMGRAGERTHRFEPGRVGGEHVLHRGAGLGRDVQRGRRDRRAQVGDAGQERVVEVEHVAGRAERGDRIPGRLGRPHGRLVAPALGAGKPIQERGRVGHGHDRGIIDT
jgi:hypothetical protein